MLKWGKVFRKSELENENRPAAWSFGASEGVWEGLRHVDVIGGFHRYIKGFRRSVPWREVN